MKRVKQLLCFNLFAILIGLVFISGCTRGADDVQFAQSTFEQLVRGDSEVESSIDFETLRLLGENVGATYSTLPNDKERADFRHSFINGFSSSYQGTGASVETFTNWRLQNSDSARSIVATDGKNGTLYLSITKRNGGQKLAAIGNTP